MAISPDDDAPEEGAAPAADGGETADETDALVADDPVLDGEGSWLVRYAREHVAHLFVLVVLGAYPAIHHVLTLPTGPEQGDPLMFGGEVLVLFGVKVFSPVGPEARMLLPDVDTMIAVFYFGLFAMSFDFISGYTGYLSFGHAVFYGAGAYFVVLAANGKVPLLPHTTPFMLLLVLAGLLAVVLALVIGAVSFRLTGVYFAMITLGFSQVVYVFVRDWSYVGSNPRDGPAIVGPEGAGPPALDIGVPFVDRLNVAIGALAGETVELGGLVLGGAGVSYYAVGAVVVVCYLAMQRIVHSPFGRVMVAIRENEERAAAVGYDTFRYKLAAFAVSGFFAAVAGGLFAGYRQSVSPENSLFFLVTGDALLASIIGGFGTLAGPLYGRLFDETVREFLSKEGAGGGLLPYLRGHLSEGTLATEIYNGLTVQGAIETFLNGHAALYIGLLFVVFVLFVPNGLLGTVRARLGGPVAKQVGERIRRLRE